MQTGAASAGRRSAHYRVAVARDVYVHHRVDLRAIERLRQERRSQEPVLFHVEEDDLNAMAQPASAQRFSHPGHHHDTRAVVHHAVTVTAAAQWNRIEMRTENDQRTITTEGFEQHVLSLLARIALAHVVGERLQREGEAAVLQQTLHRVQASRIGWLVEQARFSHELRHGCRGHQ